MESSFRADQQCSGRFNENVEEGEQRAQGKID